MAITKVWIDEDECTGCGLCEDSCPEVFELNDIAEVKEGADFNEFEERIEERSVEAKIEEIDFMNYFGGKKVLFEQVKTLQKKWKVAELPKQYLSEKENIKLLAMGKIHDFGEGCACPINALSSKFLEVISLKDKFGIHLCGENGEYHTFVVDGPIFKEHIDILNADKNLERGQWFLKILKYKIRKK